MARTVEVAHPDEHFAFPEWTDIITASDGGGGSISAAVGYRTPSADPNHKGQIVFFFHNHRFVGWDASREAVLVQSVVPSGLRKISVTYFNYASGDSTVAPSLRPARIVYRWNGHRMVPDRQPPPGIYGLKDPSAKPIYVRLAP